MERRIARLRGALGLACLFSVGACNAVLGIDEPAPGVRNPGSSGAPPQDSDSNPVGSAPRDAGVDSGEEAGEPVEPSEYAWADWPMPNPAGGGAANPQTYTTRSEGVVADSITQLEWQQTVDDVLRTWDEATQYCAELELAGGGFRLPARIELLSLIDFTRPNPSIDVSAFPDAPAERFWTASSFGGTRSNVWIINFEFATGFSFQSHKSEKHRVRCVR